MNAEDVKRILVIGAGTMGQQVGLQCAVHGYEVVLYDIEEGILQKAIKGVHTYAGQLVSSGFLTGEDMAAALARISATTDALKAAVEVDLVSESIPEDPRLKGQVFARFNDLCPARTIFTTNTSTLAPSMYAKETGRPAQFASLHFHQPVWHSNVVDIMPHPGTSPETIALLEGFARRIDQVPIVLKKESSGYVFNAMLNALLRSAMELVVNEVASVEDVDRSFMGIMKTPIGPFGILDLVGLDTAWKISDYWARKAFFMRELRRNADFLKTYVDEGLLGMKSGQGFYSYPDPAYEQPGFVKGEDKQSN